MQDDFFQQSAKVLTVAELTRSIRALLETRFGAVWVQGEISNYKLHPSGHQYFTLKDARAQISCVIFRNTLPRSAASLADGLQVQLYGNISVFEARGLYQLSVQIVQTRGAGLLQAKFEALKRKLEAEGLFATARKRPLPKHPRRIGIITSPTGAAIRDILNVLQRRAPGVQILISPVRVQGVGAAAEIAVALKELALPNDSWPPLDLIVLARGGGSMEDLWEFNEEIVARAIAASPLPVVSAIGHEIDFTIADFVADLRAPTPSAAAELIVADVEDVQRRLQELANCLNRCWRNFVAENRARLRLFSERTLGRELATRVRDAKQQLDFARDSINRSAHEFFLGARRSVSAHGQFLKAHRPERELTAARTRLAEFTRRFAVLPSAALQKSQQRFHSVESVLRVLGPDATLRRGYSVTTDAAGKIIRSVKNTKPGMRLRTRLADGEIESDVTQQKKSAG